MILVVDGLEVLKEVLIKMTLRMSFRVHFPHTTSYPLSLRKVSDGSEPPMPWLHGMTALSLSYQPQLPHQVSNISPNQTILLIPHGETFFLSAASLLPPGHASYHTITQQVQHSYKERLVTLF